LEPRTPWLGLLLWAFACAGLLVSLIVERSAGIEQPRLAARAVSAVELSPSPPLLHLEGGGDLTKLSHTR
jgi:hypothetical protein